MDKETLIKVSSILILHTRVDIRGCHCGWGELGKSHAEHVAKELDKEGLINHDHSN